MELNTDEKTGSGDKEIEYTVIFDAARGVRGPVAWDGAGDDAVAIQCVSWIAAVLQ